MQYSVHCCIKIQSVTQVQAMYFANPPVMPSLDFYREAFELLMKYNDLWVLKK